MKYFIFFEKHLMFHSIFVNWNPVLPSQYFWNLICSSCIVLYTNWTPKLKSAKNLAPTRGIFLLIEIPSSSIFFLVSFLRIFFLQFRLLSCSMLTFATNNKNGKNVIKSNTKSTIKVLFNFLCLGIIIYSSCWILGIRVIRLKMGGCSQKCLVGALTIDWWWLSRLSSIIRTGWWVLSYIMCYETFMEFHVGALTISSHLFIP